MADFTEQDQPIKLVDSAYNSDSIQHFKELSIGAGTNVFKANAEGVFIGGTDFTSAPISFTYSGVQKLGISNLTLDGPNKRMLVNDGTNDRVLIGFLSGKF